MKTFASRWWPLAPRRKTPSGHLKCLACLLLSTQAALLAYGAYVHSPVYDETAHLPAGASWWLLGRTDIYPQNPPLVKCVAALPLVMQGVEFNWRHVDAAAVSRSEFELGFDFSQLHGERTFWYFTLARWACLPFATLGGVIIYLWSSALFGRTGGLLSLALWCFSPNILANGQLITPDCAATSLMLAAAYCFRNWLHAPTWRRATLAGFVLGLAELAKFTCVVLFPLWIVIWAVVRWRQGRDQSNAMTTPGFGQLTAILLLGVFLINAGYGFRGSLTPLGKHRFQSKTLSGLTPDAYRQGPGANRFQRTWLGAVPVPLPRDYVRGIDLQKCDFEYGLVGYLRGEWKQGGWWYYYLYAMGVKVPLGTLCLGAVAVAGASWQRPSSNQLIDWLCLGLPTIAVLTLVSSQTGVNLFMRYILPFWPFLAVTLGSTMLPARSALLKGVGLACLIWSAGNSLTYYPHSISYFNELAGGPLNGSKHLLDGNIGWGQDLLFLKKWYDQHPEVRPLGLVYFGNLDANIAGIKFFLPDRGSNSRNNRCPKPDQLLGPKPGWYAVDVSFVHGMNRIVYDENGHWVEPESTCDFSYFKHFEPVDRVAYSMLIYHITLHEANQVRERLGMEPLSDDEEGV